MFFQTIGTIGSYMQTVKLQQKWQQKQQTPASPEAAMFSHLRKQLEQQRENQPVEAISYKLQAGKKLSPAELDYLRQNHPELYQEAVELEAKRQAHERALQQCKTKEEARAVHLAQIGSLVGRAKQAEAKGDLQASQAVQMEANTLKEAYNKFVSGDRYGELAENEAEREEALRAQQAEQQGGPGQTERENEVAEESPAPDMAESEPEAAGPVADPAPDVDVGKAKAQSPPFGAAAAPTVPAGAGQGRVAAGPAGYEQPGSAAAPGGRRFSGKA